MSNSCTDEEKWYLPDTYLREDSDEITVVEEDQLRDVIDKKVQFFKQFMKDSFEDNTLLLEIIENEEEEGKIHCKLQVADIMKKIIEDWLNFVEQEHDESLLVCMVVQTNIMVLEWKFYGAILSDNLPAAIKYKKIVDNQSSKLLDELMFGDDITGHRINGKKVGATESLLRVSQDLKEDHKLREMVLKDYINILKLSL